QSVLYTITGLISGTHTITIEVTGTKNASSQGYWIWVDAFDYLSDGGSATPPPPPPPPPPSGTTYSRVEQNNSAVTYTGTWYANNYSSNSGGSAVLASDRGARATFTFSGTAVKWIGWRDAWSGIANVYIDGVLKTQVEDYAAKN